MEKIIGIYKITTPTDKIYIGQSTNCLIRKSYYSRASCAKQIRLHASLQKYGWKAHKFEIIHVCLESELNELEIYYIDLFKSFNTPHGLNLQSGGGNYKLSEETKLKIGNKRRGKKGAKHTEEHKKYMSKILSGRIRSKEHSENISKSKKGKTVRKGFKLTMEHKCKLSEAMMGHKRGVGKSPSLETREKIRVGLKKYREQNQ